MRITGLGKGYCFSVRVGHAWPADLQGCRECRFCRSKNLSASVHGATHYKTASLAKSLSNSVFVFSCLIKNSILVKLAQALGNHSGLTIADFMAIDIDYS